MSRRLLPILCSLMAVAAGCGMMAIGGRGVQPEANLFTVQGAVAAAPTSTIATLAGAATAGAPAERVRPPVQRVVVLGDSTGEFLGRAMATVQGFEVDVRALRRCPLRPDEHTGKMRPTEPDEGQWQITDNGATYAGESCGWRNYIDKIDLSFADVYVFAGPMMLTNMDDGNVFTAAPTFTAEMAELVEVLWSKGTSKIVVVAPPLSKAEYGHPDMFWLDPARNDAWTAILRDISVGVAGESAGACFLDYANWAAGQPDPREDGAHMAGAEGQRHAAWILQQVRDGACSL